VHEFNDLMMQEGSREDMYLFVSDEELPNDMDKPSRAQAQEHAREDDNSLPRLETAFCIFNAKHNFQQRRLRLLTMLGLMHALGACQDCVYTRSGFAFMYIVCCIEAILIVDSWCLVFAFCATNWHILYIMYVFHILYFCSTIFKQSTRLFAGVFSKAKGMMLELSIALMILVEVLDNPGKSDDKGVFPLPDIMPAEIMQHASIIMEILLQQRCLICDDLLEASIALYPELWEDMDQDKVKKFMSGEDMTEQEEADLNRAIFRGSAKSRARLSTCGKAIQLVSTLCCRYYACMHDAAKIKFL
jgi:hypothetical protein